MNTAYFPTKTIVPSTQIVHDRSNLEIFRGCIRGCRFCQAGFCYRPIRAKSADVLCKQAIESLEDSGNSEITLASLSTSDYRELEALADGLLDYCEPRKINLSLPSLRADNFSRELMMRIQKVRKSGLTFAPEAGTQRLRDAINKNVTEEEILSTCATAFSGGWNSVKLYFMLGLPTETDEDVVGIAELVYKILQVWRENGSGKKRGLSINLATAYFVPKPFTPFQWAAQITLEYDRGVPEQAERTITELFSGGPVLVKKRTKSGGEAELDLTPMIFGLSMRKASAQELELTVLVSAQNPSCNPQLLVNAIERYLPEQKPDFARIKRLEIYDEQGNPFR